MRIATVLAFVVAALGLPPGAALAQHQHGGQGGSGAGAPADKGTCAEPVLACATAATPFVAGDRLWLAWVAGGRIAVAASTDGGHRFGPPVLLNPAVEKVDTGPDARPRVVVDGAGRVVVSWAVFRGRAWVGEAWLAVSTDGGASFTRERLTSVDESQRFESLAVDPAGRVFAAWIDKRRNAEAARDKRPYPGAALAFAWLDGASAQPAPARIAQDNSCECCRLGIGFAGPGRPVVVFRNIFDGGVRDHAVTTFADADTPGPIHRVAVDDWRIDACPHHGPSLAVAPDGSYHVTWFTEGSARQGTFYARSADGGRSFSAPMAIGQADRQPSRAFVLAARGALWLAWKEFDGDHTAVKLMTSRDGGRSWSEPRAVAATADDSDHPLLIEQGGAVRLSWLSKADGYRLIPVEPGS